MGRLAIQKIREIFKEEKEETKNEPVLEIDKRSKKRTEKMEKMIPDHFNQPEIKQIGSNVFEEIKESTDNQTDIIKEVATESRPILTDEKMKEIEKGASEFESQEKIIQDILDGKIPVEEFNHPYYVKPADKKPKKNKPVPDNNPELKFR